MSIKGYKTLKKWLIWERKQSKKMGCLLPRTTNQNNMAEIPEVEEVPSLLLPCVTCGRTFRPEALAKHTNVCEKNQVKKRKKFDSAKQRIQGTELADFLGPPPITGSKPKPPSPKKVQSRWKEKHEALKRIIRDEPTKPPDHQQCPYCERYFGPKPFDRHVAWCKEQHTKIQPNSHVNEDVYKAKERLQARTKYRAPHFKSQRSVTKEKYSPGRRQSGQINLSMSTSATFPSPASERLQRTSMSSSSTELGLNIHDNSGYGKSRSSSICSSTIPSLTRQNSLQRTSVSKLNSNIGDNLNTGYKYKTSKEKECSDMSTPVLNRKQRGGSVSSQGSVEGGRSTSSSNYSANTFISDNNLTHNMSTNQDSSKPNIKTSHSTNRKCKKNESAAVAALTGCQNKKWKRKANDATNEKRNDIDLNCYVDSSQPVDPTTTSGTKLWKRFTTQTKSIAQPLEKKLKKIKSKTKKPKVISPDKSVKSGSSRKTITLSDNQNNLDNLIDMNKMVEANSDVSDFDLDQNKGTSPSYDISTDFNQNPDGSFYSNFITDVEIDENQDNKNLLENESNLDRDKESCELTEESVAVLKLCNDELTGTVSFSSCDIAKSNLISECDEQFDTDLLQKEDTYQYSGDLKVDIDESDSCDITNLSFIKENFVLDVNLNRKLSCKHIPCKSESKESVASNVKSKASNKVDKYALDYKDTETDLRLIYCQTVKDEMMKSGKLRQCECDKIMNFIKEKLTLLSKCKCLKHEKINRSFTNGVRLMKSDVHIGLKNNHNRKKVNKHKNICYSDPEMYSHSCMESEKLNDIKQDLKESFEKFQKTTFYGIDVETQTENTLIKNKLDTEKLFDEYSIDSQSELSKKYQANMGDRLTNIRRLLNRSSDSFDKYRSNSNELFERNSQYDNEDLSGFVQLSNNHNNEVVLTSVKCLSNTLENLNRRIALREWKLIQSDNNYFQHQEVDHLESGHSYKRFGGGDATVSNYSLSNLHLPPLYNSTPKRLNRRWSPINDQSSGAITQDDTSALSKFCHECGGRYPVPGAKFCCICGVRRLAI